MITGVIIKELRDKKNRMTQDELADKVGVTRGMVQQWENGSRISKNKLPLLCKIFGVTSEVFETKIESRNDSQVMEELKSTFEYLKEQIDVLNQDKNDLKELLKMAMSGNFPKDNGYPSLRKVEKSNKIEEPKSKVVILKTA